MQKLKVDEKKQFKDQKRNFFEAIRTADREEIMKSLQVFISAKNEDKYIDGKLVRFQYIDDDKLKAMRIKQLMGRMKINTNSAREIF